MDKSNKKRRRILWITMPILAVVLATVIFCVIYVNDYYRADEGALASLNSTAEVTVDIYDDAIYFTPKNDTGKGIIFYPGGKVELSAYAPLAMSLAEKGILCVLVKMPCNLAVLGINSADKILSQTDTREWYMAGHSLGGAMASSYIADNHELFEGLILLGAYANDDISHTALDVISIYGEYDGVMDREKYNSSLSLLPSDAKEQVIIGGNHAYFGSYGEQEGDGVATISPEEQIMVTASLIYGFILA